MSADEIVLPEVSLLDPGPREQEERDEVGRGRVGIAEGEALSAQLVDLRDGREDFTKTTLVYGVPSETRGRAPISWCAFT